MSEARWTWSDIPRQRGWHPVPTFAGSLWWVENPDYPDAEGWSVIDLFDHTNPTAEELESRAALVAAVRDADLLRQARQIRDLLMTQAVDPLDGKWVSRYVALLDLLAPMSGTGTPGPACAACEDRGWVWVQGESGMNQGWPADCPDCPPNGPPLPDGTQTEEET